MKDTVKMNPLIKSEPDNSINRLRQEELNVTKTRYTELFKESADAMLIISKNRFIDCNKATVDMLGYNNKTEFLDTHPSELSPPKQPDGKNSLTKADRMMQLAQENGNHRFEWDHVRANGEVFPVEVLLTTISSEEHGELFHTVWRDITQRKQAQRLEEAISALARKLTAIIDMKEIAMVAAKSIRSYFESDAISINYIDHKALINRGVYTEDTPIGATEPTEFEPLSTPFEKLDPDSIQGTPAPKLLNRPKEALSKKPLGRPFGEIDRRSASLLFAPIMWDNTKVGEVTAQSYTLNKYSEKSLNQLQMFANQIGGAFLRALVSENLLQEHEELLRNQSRLKMSQELAHVGTWENDAEKGSSYWSDELYKIYDIDPKVNVRLKHLLDRIHPDDVELFHDEVKTKAPIRTDYRIILPDGTIRYIHEELGKPDLKDGVAVVERGSAQDISRLKNAENQLFQSQKLEALGTMVGGIAHELNNVLQGVFLYGGILESQLPQDENIQTSFKAIMSGHDRAHKIISQIMAFSRQSETNFEVQDIKPILMEAIDFQKALTASQIEIIGNIGESSGLVRCDSTQLRQIIMNLCNNAIDAMPDGGKLDISMIETRPSHELLLKDTDDKENVFLEINVSDTGSGMDKDTLQKIFDPFFTTKEVGKGTGLGLSLVHGMVEQLGGNITATSTIGKGSTFKILLPSVDKKHSSGDGDNT
jgi:PAS domain S-box-containing protein